jgi:hypothetical protein
MTYDPDGDTEDRLHFLEGGEFVATEPSSGQAYRGMYVVRTDHIKVNLVHEGRIFASLQLTFDENKDKLYFESAETGNTSHYTKIR